MTGQAARCSYFDKEIYDCAATTKLISLFMQHPWVRLVYFNDPAVQKAVGRVRSCIGHNDHFHVELWPRYAS
ncbi:hypothetical protein GTP23_21600 [Pseudoduganella sp. FT93W]|uniref:Uncharacterized protein n=1 Tax=Duganella fentianensis TaxID=2692177 RepID=A0A845I5Y8_9BURK|nr:hypothetical protein [Duganella fentianensis]MYN47641.1 hypothetical protein [Duganella fentianensis]